VVSGSVYYFFGGSLIHRWGLRVWILAGDVEFWPREHIDKGRRCEGHNLPNPRLVTWNFLRVEPRSRGGRERERESLRERKFCTDVDVFSTPPFRGEA
jgi:hypothetical protein